MKVVIDRPPHPPKKKEDEPLTCTHLKIKKSYPKSL